MFSFVNAPMSLGDVDEAMRWVSDEDSADGGSTCYGTYADDADLDASVDRIISDTLTSSCARVLPLDKIHRARAALDSGADPRELVRGVNREHLSIMHKMATSMCAGRDIVLVVRDLDVPDLGKAAKYAEDMACLFIALQVAGRAQAYCQLLDCIYAAFFMM